MLKKTASFVLGCIEILNVPQQGTPPASTRLRPCWTVFWSILLTVALRFTFHVLPFTFLGVEVGHGRHSS